MFKNQKTLFLVTLYSLFLGGLPAFAQEQQPDTQDAADLSPRYQYDQRPHHQVPFLGGVGDVARQSALAFIDYAGFSMVDEREDVRRGLIGASQNPDVARAFCDEAFNAQTSDHTRALVALSLLGEMRSEVGMSCLYSFLWQPLPETGTISEGDEIVERTSLSILEAKAVEGLAYLRNAASDQMVLEAIANHPARAVRASAIDAFKWNHGDAPDAVQMMLGYVQPDELVFIDRIRRETGETADTFNAKLTRFLSQHPELIPPDPVRGDASEPQEPDDVAFPPQW